MRKGKIKIILVIMLIVIIVLIGLYYYFTRWGTGLSSSMKKQMHYKILYITANNNIKGEYYFILDKNGKVTQTRATESGYSSEELEKQFSIYTNMQPLYFDVEKNQNSLIYSTTKENGKTADEIKNEYNNSVFSDVSLKLN